MRSDIHSPTYFDPASYTYVGSFDNWPEPGTFVSPTRANYDTVFGCVNALNPAHADYLAGRDLLRREGAKIHFDPDGETCNCDHCGARIRYVTIYRHKNGECIAVGNDCAANRFGCDSRREYDIKRLKERAVNEREKARVFGKASEFVAANCPELGEWLLSPAAEQVHPIFADMARRLVRWGNLSEKQIAFARKLLQEYYERQRNEGKTNRELEREEEKARAADCPIGRQTVQGEVVKTEYRDSPYGGTLKMVFKSDQGFLLWGSVPSSLQLVEVEGLQRGLQRGDRVELTATLERSEKDPKFGFFKRPRGRLLSFAVSA
ncbi:MAG: hypothetical protein KGL39_00480 [Patescibacteria group bacterium]|nr:hypothetical protein [Patescibacteria group bacterium]